MLDLEENLSIGSHAWLQKSLLLMLLHLMIRKLIFFLTLTYSYKNEKVPIAKFVGLTNWVLSM